MPPGQSEVPVSRCEPAQLWATGGGVEVEQQVDGLVQHVLLMHHLLGFEHPFDLGTGGEQVGVELLEEGPVAAAGLQPQVDRLRDTGWTDPSSVSAIAISC